MSSELKELIAIMKKNTFYTGTGALTSLVALLIALVALFK